MQQQNGIRISHLRLIGEKIIMKRNNDKGLFIAFDGPNGVGKSTLIQHTKNTLIENGIKVWTTKEPTDTPLGTFIQEISKTLRNESLAYLIAADRYQHLSNEILPQLKKEQVVITDRYILSSLILQRMDNVDVNLICLINSGIILPDIQVVVKADQEIIQSRLNERGKLTRFEQGNRTSEELFYLREGTKILRNIGVEIVEIKNSEDISVNINFIVEYIRKAMER